MIMELIEYKKNIIIILIIIKLIENINFKINNNKINRKYDILCSSYRI